MDDITTDPSACASPDGATPTLTPDAGAQTERSVVTVASIDWPGYGRNAVIPGSATLIVDGDEVVVGLSLDGDDPYVYPTASHTTDEQDDAIATAIATAWEAHEDEAQREHRMCGGAS